LHMQIADQSATQSFQCRYPSRKILWGFSQTQQCV
jgi:hypothetical protein